MQTLNLAMRQSQKKQPKQRWTIYGMHQRQQAAICVDSLAITFDFLIDESESEVSDILGSENPSDQASFIRRFWDLSKGI